MQGEGDADPVYSTLTQTQPQRPSPKARKTQQSSYELPHTPPTEFLENTPPGQIASTSASRACFQAMRLVVSSFNNYDRYTTRGIHGLRSQYYFEYTLRDLSGLRKSARGGPWAV